MNKEVSTITISDIADYLRLSETTASDRDFIGQCLEIAKAYIKSYTGVEDLDEVTEFVIVVYVLCQDMYDTRALYVDNGNINKVIDSILKMHSRNLL